MDLYRKALEGAKSDEEKLEILAKVGISSLRREKDLGNYIGLLERKQNTDIMMQTDFEMMEPLTPKEKSYANTLKTRRELINYVLSINSKNSKVQENKSNSSFEACVRNAEKKNMKLCPRGYCTAKEKFQVYPSAYANGYASQVCNGNKPDLEGNYSNDYEKEGKEKDTESGLSRWFKEEWVNVCETDNKGNYLPCGRKEADIDDSSSYPYCRPLHKLPGTTVKSVPELSNQDISRMCKEKRSLQQGVDKKPTRVYI